MLGRHPHVVHDHELYRGEPIVHSPGDFVFDGIDDAGSRTGWSDFVDFDKAGAVSLSTTVVRVEPDGSPIPDASRAGPCRTRGTAQMSDCAGQPPR